MIIFRSKVVINSLIIKVLYIIVIPATRASLLAALGLFTISWLKQNPCSNTNENQVALAIVSIDIHRMQNKI